MVTKAQGITRLSLFSVKNEKYPYIAKKKKKNWTKSSFLIFNIQIPLTFYI